MVAGRARMNPDAVAATPLIWSWAPGPAGTTPGGTASVQVAPPSRLSQAALVTAGPEGAGMLTSPAIRIWFR